MSIEIRQLLIKSNVVQKQGEERDGNAESAPDEGTEGLKEDILAECRRLILDILSERGER